MRAKAMDPSGNAHTAKRLAPSNGIRLSAGLDRQCIGALGASPDDFIYLFLEVDERLFHNEPRVGCCMAGSKPGDTPIGKGAQLTLSERGHSCPHRVRS